MSKVYEIQTPDGKTIKVEGPEDATDDELIAFAREQMADARSKYAKNPVSVNRPVNQPTITVPKDSNRSPGLEAMIARQRAFRGDSARLTDLLVDGATFSLADEASGVIGALGNVITSPFTGNFDPAQAYRDDRDFARYNAAQAKEQYPVSGVLAQIAGGFAGLNPANALAGVARTAVGTIKSGAKVGALAGAAGGFGSGTDAESSLVQSGLGALFGSALGAALPVAAMGVSNRVRAYNRLLGRDQEGVARQIVGSALSADANTGASAGAAMDHAHGLGVPYMLADTGENARGLVASVGRQPGPARSTVLAAVSERQRGQGDRIRGAIERDLGPITNTALEAEALRDAARAAAQGEATAAESALSGAVDRIAPVSDRAASGATARETFEAAYDAARQRTREAYNSPELTTTQSIEIPVEFFARDFRKAADDFYGDGGGEIPAALRQIIDDAAAPEATTRTLTNIDRRLADFAGEARMSGRKSDAAFAERVRGDLNAFADRSAPPAYRQALATAKAVRAEQGRVFETRDLPQTFARDQFGNARVGDTAVPGRLARPGAPGGDTADSLVAAVGVGQAEGLVRSELRRVVEDIGTPTATQARALVTRYGEMVQRFPALANDLAAIQAGASGLEVAQGALLTAGRPGSTALEQGAAALNLSADEIERIAVSLSPVEREQFAQGYRNALAGSLDRRVDDADKARAVLGTPRKRAALERLYPGEGLDRFGETLAAEQASNQTFRSVAGGSQTAERLAFDAQAADGGIAETVLDAGLRGGGQNGWLGAVTSGFQKLREVDRFGPGEAGNRVRQSVAALLTETDPAELRRMLAEANAAALAREQATQSTGNFGILAGQGLARGLVTSAGGMSER